MIFPTQPFRGTKVAEATPESQDTWVRDFILTWINRFSFFFAHHLTRPLLPLYLVSFGASSTVVGAVIGVFTITSTIMRVPVVCTSIA